MSYDRKAGGAYVTVTGRVRHISVPEKTLVMEDGAVIPIDSIAALEVAETGEVIYLGRKSNEQT